LLLPLALLLEFDESIGVAGDRGDISFRARVTGENKSDFPLIAYEIVQGLNNNAYVDCLYSLK